MDVTILRTYPFPFSFSVGGLTTLTRCSDAALELDVPEPVAPFSSSADRPDIDLEVSVKPLAEPSAEGLVCDSGGIWRIHQTPEGWRLTCPPTWPARLFELDRGLAHGHLYCDPRTVRQEDGHRAVQALERPGFQILHHWRLAQDGGLVVHSAGVVHEGRGLLFAGTSGAGKTTISRLWNAHGATVLSDERNCLRPAASGPTQIYGTPWPSVDGFWCNQQADLAAIFLIEHAPQNALQSITGAEAAARLYAFSFVPPFDPLLIAQSLRVAQRIAGAVPCFRLGFVPDPSVIDCVLRVL